MRKVYCFVMAVLCLALVVPTLVALGFPAIVLSAAGWEWPLEKVTALINWLGRRYETYWGEKS